MRAYIANTLYVKSAIIGAVLICAPIYMAIRAGYVDFEAVMLFGGMGIAVYAAGWLLRYIVTGTKRIF